MCKVPHKLVHKGPSCCFPKAKKKKGKKHYAHFLWGWKRAMLRPTWIAYKPIQYLEAINSKGGVDQKSAKKSLISPFENGFPPHIFWALRLLSGWAPTTYWFQTIFLLLKRISKNSFFCTFVHKSNIKYIFFNIIWTFGKNQCLQQ
jgi:hypothetical protein